ncbi:MAG TPA: acyltransferase family protein [Bryobacteraceae bacterium]|nr:acyltransferase family protein [Bryobacteraceae bacterium]
MASATVSTAPTERSNAPAVQREFGLDWLRVIAFGILIFYHTGMFFVPWGWHIKNPEQSESLTYVMLFFNRWRLPLLFFISGAGVFFSLRRRTFGQFASERFIRLAIPLVFGMLMVVPPQIYVERLHKGQFSGSYFEFWPSVLQGVAYPQGNTSWHHLWFVAYILTYSLICIPLFAAMRTTAGRRTLDALTKALTVPGVILLAVVPNYAAAVWLGPRWPTTHNLVADWANFAGCLLAFLLGYVVCGSVRLLDCLTERRRWFLSFALLMTVVFYAMRMIGGASPTVRSGVDCWFGWGWILTAVSFSRAHLNCDSPFLRYATEAVYPFYILHQTVLLLIAYAMLNWDQRISVKLPLLMLGTFIGSWIGFELVRRSAITRLLFGMRPRSRTTVA